ncbi:MAG: flagellar hook-length control protein FliK [bacterium]
MQGVLFTLAAQPVNIDQSPPPVSKEPESFDKLLGQSLEETQKTVGQGETVLNEQYPKEPDAPPLGLPSTSKDDESSAQETSIAVLAACFIAPEFIPIIPDVAPTPANSTTKSVEETLSALTQAVAKQTAASSTNTIGTIATASVMPIDVPVSQLFVLPSVEQASVMPSAVMIETQTAALTTQSQQPIAATSMQASTQQPNEAPVIAPPMLTNEVAEALFVESVAGNSVTPFELKGVAETQPQEVGTVTPKVETVTPSLIPQAQPLVTVDDVPISEVNTDIGNSEIVAETTKVAQNVVADPLVATEKSTAPVQQVQDTRQAVTGKVEPKQTASSDTVITEITTAQVENRPLIADNLSAREAVLGKAIEPRGNTPNNVTPSKTAVDVTQPAAEAVPVVAPQVSAITKDASVSITTEAATTDIPVETTNSNRTSQQSGQSPNDQKFATPAQFQQVYQQHAVKAAEAASSLGQINEVDRIALAQQVGRYIAQAHANGQERTISLRLDPPQLGSVEVTVHTVGKVVDANVVTQHEGTRQALLSSLDQLRDSLASRGLSLGQVNVSAQQGQQGQTPNWAPVRRSFNPSATISIDTASMPAFNSWHTGLLDTRV